MQERDFDGSFMRKPRPRKRTGYLPLKRVSYVKGPGRAREALDMARDAVPFPAHVRDCPVAQCPDADRCMRQGCQVFVLGPPKAGT